MTSSSSRQQISIIGLGLLGSAVARRWRDSKYEVTGFDVSREARQRFETSEGKVAADLKECLEGNQLCVFCLPDETASRNVLNSILELDEASHPALILDMTTGAPDVMEENWRMCERVGLDYLDACVAGSSQEAEHGEAILLVGGNDEAVAASRSVLNEIGREIFHVGGAGQGARMKLVTNLVLGLERLVLAEGLSFANAMGFDGQKTLEVLQAGPARSHVMTTKGPKMIAEEWTPQARLDQHWKDVRLILSEGQKLGSELPLSQLHDQILEKCHKLGWGELDNSAVIRAYLT